jgi:hypothetical protein
VLLKNVLSLTTGSGHKNQEEKNTGLVTHGSVTILILLLLEIFKHA